MELGFEQLKALLRSVGFPENVIDRMARIGILESAGDATVARVCPGNGRCAITKNGRTTIVPAVRGQGPESSYGLFQINTRAHPQYSPSLLSDPYYNAKAALEVFKKQGFNAWKLSNQKVGAGAIIPETSGNSDVNFDTNVSVIGPRNRYLLAFAILVIVFIFTFKN